MRALPKRYRAVFVRFVALLSLFAIHIGPADARAEEPEAFFPIMPWDHPPLEPAVLAKMRDCGFTIAGFVAPSGLDACHEAGMKAIVSDARVSDYDWHAVDEAVARTRVTELINQTRNHPAVFGYYLRDEPPTDYFPGLAKVASLVKELHPGAWPYVNLYPNYADPPQLGAATYDEYLTKFVETVKPPILSYDHYALLENDTIRDNYFANLEAMRNVATAHDTPFWQIVLSTAHFTYREVTDADLRFEAYTSLAYGARGLSYFTYFSRPIGNFRMGPIDHFGAETPTWRSMRHVNLQIAKLAPTLLKLKSDRVYHFGEAPPGTSAPDENSMIANVNGPMLVGEFTHEDGSRWVMIVNRDFKRNYPCQPQFRSPVTNLQFVSPYTGALTAFAGEHIWLAPGQGVLLKPTFQ